MYAVRVVIVDPHASVGSVIHGGLEGPALIAEGQLTPLIRAAEESLSV